MLTVSCGIGYGNQSLLSAAPHARAECPVPDIGPSKELRRNMSIREDGGGDRRRRQRREEGSYLKTK